MAAWNLALRFGLEIGSLVVLAVAGWTTMSGPVRWIAAVVIPAIAVMSWGVFNVVDDPSRSGRAPVEVPGWIRLTIELAVLGGGVVALALADQRRLAFVFAFLIAAHYGASASRIRWLLNGGRIRQARIESGGASSTWTLRTRVGWSLLLAGAALAVLVSARYLTFDPAVYFPRQREVYESHTAGLMLHIIGMIGAALLGPFQFLRSFRNRYPRVHSISGRVYLTSTLAGGLGGLYMAQFSASGLVSGVGFALLACGVLLTSALAYRRIRHGDVQSHREWMTRSYALIFAAVTLRLYQSFLEVLLGEQRGYALVAWLCWMPNLLVAEWMVRRRLRLRREAPVRTAKARGALARGAADNPVHRD